MAHQTLKVGLQLPQIEGLRGPSVRGWSELLEISRVAEDIGMDSLWVSDHLLYQLEGEDRGRGCWEVWSLISALAASTKRVELGTLVLAMGWRNPTLLAKMADTVDEISGGRLILGLGAGYHRREYEAFGFSFDHRVSRFEEGIQIVHSLLREGAVDFEGRYYTARECELRPRGPRANGPPILIGTAKPRMLGLTARYADLWNAYYDDIHNQVSGLERIQPAVDAACREAGRDPGTLERTVTLLVADATADPWWDRLPVEQLEGAAPLLPLSGSADELAEQFALYHARGISQIQICLEPTTPASVEALAPILERLKR